MDLAAVIGDDRRSSEMADALLREKSARSAAYDLLSDHKPVFADLCCGSGDPRHKQHVPAWRVGPIRMSRVGDIGRAYTQN